MAPITRSGTPTNQISKQHFNAQQAMASHMDHEDSWQLNADESDREPSSDPSGSFQDYDGDSEYDSIGYEPTRELDLAEDHEDILHPLREAANRVGREVERFAEVLDGYNPLKAIDNADRKEMTFDLIHSYHDIAVETVKRLRAEHSRARRRHNGALTKTNAGESAAFQDSDAMDEDESDGQEPPAMESKTTPQDLERWEQEARTWDLLRRMAALQYNPPKRQKVSQIHRYSSEREVWDSFLENDTLGLERNTVLEWLKSTADESGEDIDVLVQEHQQNAQRGDITAHGWLHTKAAIKNQKRIFAWPYILDHKSPDVQRVHLNASRTEPLATELDPDAPARQNRKLEEADQSFERAVWRGCYELLRRGKSGAEIREWCRDRQEIWRAVSLSGLPDESAGLQDESLDPKSRTLWRRMCYALSQRGGNNPYENAVYGILSGGFWGVEDVCSTWDDYLFAHYNALIRHQYENYVLKHFPSRTPLDGVQNMESFDAIAFHGDPETVGPRTVDLISNKPKLWAETRQPLKMIQGVLVAKDFYNFIYEQGLAISQAANASSDSKSVLIADLHATPKNAHKMPYVRAEDFDNLRVLTHMLLAFKSFGMEIGKNEEYAIESVIVAYISFLRLAGKEELIPLYAAQLSEERAYATLSRELLDVTDPEQRTTQIKLMKELGLDVQKFAQLQIAFLMQDYPDTEKEYPASGNFDIVISQDRQKQELCRRIRTDFIGDVVERPEALMIRAFEWYQYVEGMWSETFRTGTMLYMRFFKHMKLAATRELANCMAARDIAANKTPTILGDTYELSDLTAEPEEEDNISEDHEGTAELTKLLKRHMAAESRSFQDLENLVHALDFIESVAGIIDALQRKPDERLIRQLRVEFFKNFQGIRQSVTALLHDWLVHGRSNDKVEFSLLREAYLPEVILAYDSILSNAGLYVTRNNFLDAMELSSMIAAEGSDLANLFVKTGKMKQLVESFATDSATLLYSTHPGKSPGKPSRRAKEKGWSRNLWRFEA